MRSLTPEVVAHDAEAYLDALQALQAVTAPLGTVGYCMGGRHWAALFGLLDRTLR